MYDYVVSELPALLSKEFPQLDTANASIMGHSMGGHGALTIALKNPSKYKARRLLLLAGAMTTCNPAARAAAEGQGRARSDARAAATVGHAPPPTLAGRLRLLSDLQPDRGPLGAKGLRGLPRAGRVQVEGARVRRHLAASPPAPGAWRACSVTLRKTRPTCGKTPAQEYDTVELLKGYTGPHFPVLVDQGTADNFLANQLKPEALKEAAAAKGWPIEVRMQEEYDHSYYFIATFIDDHLRHHAKALSA